jgi:hypothetical protein
MFFSNNTAFSRPGQVVFIIFSPDSIITHISIFVNIFQKKNKLPANSDNSKIELPELAQNITRNFFSYKV